MTRLLTAATLAFVGALLAVAALPSSAAACALTPTDPDCNGYVRTTYNTFNTVSRTAGLPCEADERPDCDPGPTNPYCDMFNPTGRVCVTVKKDFLYKAIDTSNGARNDCTVTLEGSAPESQTDPENRPDVQYRTSIKCDSPLQVVSIKPRLFTATGTSPIGSAPDIWCHPTTGGCGTFYTTQAGGLRDGGQAYFVRATVKLILPGGPDPWYAAMGTPANGPDSCAPPAHEGGYVVECNVELEIPATPPQS